VLGCNASAPRSGRVPIGCEQNVLASIGSASALGSPLRSLFDVEDIVADTRRALFAELEMMAAPESRWAISAGR
jgi:hypothetical protein